jgi:D-sedoheptulose 7-phosphate isomerase
MGLDEELAAHVAAIRGTVARSSGIIADIVARLCTCFEQGGKLLVCGNGGSAADAQHLAAEFMNRMRVDRRPWPAIALTTDASVLTSIANDAAYDDVFARQVEALGRGLGERPLSDQGRSAARDGDGRVHRRGWSPEHGHKL